LDTASTRSTDSTSDKQSPGRTQTQPPFSQGSSTRPRGTPIRSTIASRPTTMSTGHRAESHNVTVTDSEAAALAGQCAFSAESQEPMKAKGLVRIIPDQAFSCSPDGIRTRATALRGQRARRNKGQLRVHSLSLPSGVQPLLSRKRTCRARHCPFWRRSLCSGMQRCTDHHRPRQHADAS
jgi:hypothetical protein